MANETKIVKQEWAGHQVWVVVKDGKQGIKMYQTERAAIQAALEVR